MEPERLKQRDELGDWESIVPITEISRGCGWERSKTCLKYFPNFTILSIFLLILNCGKKTHLNLPS